MSTYVTPPVTPRGAAAEFEFQTPPRGAERGTARGTAAAFEFRPPQRPPQRTAAADGLQTPRRAIVASRSASSSSASSRGQGSTIPVHGTNIGLTPGGTLTQEQLNEISRVSVEQKCIGILDATNSNSVVSAGQSLSRQPEKKSYFPIFENTGYPSTDNATPRGARNDKKNCPPNAPGAPRIVRNFATQHIREFFELLSIIDKTTLDTYFTPVKTVSALINEVKPLIEQHESSINPMVGLVSITSRYPGIGEALDLIGSFVGTPINEFYTLRKEEGATTVSESTFSNIENYKDVYQELIKKGIVKRNNRTDVIQSISRDELDKKLDSFSPNQKHQILTVLQKFQMGPSFLSEMIHLDNTNRAKFFSIIIELCNDLINKVEGIQALELDMALRKENLDTIEKHRNTIKAVRLFAKFTLNHYGLDKENQDQANYDMLKEALNSLIKQPTPYFLIPPQLPLLQAPGQGPTNFIF